MYPAATLLWLKGQQRHTSSSVCPSFFCSEQFSHGCAAAVVMTTTNAVNNCLDVNDQQKDVNQTPN